MDQTLENRTNQEREFTMASSRNKILILEDCPEISSIYEHYCQKMNFDYDIVANGREAFQKINSTEFSYSAFVVDLMMPEQDGITFIQNLKETDPEAIVIIQSSLGTPDKIIEVMKLGVFDYLIKPVLPDSFQKTIELALQYHELRSSQSTVEKLNRDVLREQLDWLTYKESIRKSDESSLVISTIKSLSTSFSQGSGVGSIVSLLDLLKMGQETTANGAPVSQEILNLIYLNQEVLRKQLGALAEILSIAEEDPSVELVSASDLSETLTKKSESVHPYLDKKDLKIRFSSRKTKESIKIRKDWIEVAFEELLLNALKYSKAQTCIDVHFGVIDGYFCIAIKNTVEQVQALVDPEQREVLVTRPFYRVLPPVEDYSELEQYGLGLGLTAVDLIINKHRGIFHIHNVMDHTSNTIEPCVMAEVFLPLDVHAESNK